MALTHIVCFKYRKDVPEETRREHRDRLEGLAGISGVLDLEVGADVVGSPRSYDTGLIVRFTGRPALDAYIADPAHVPVAQFGSGLCESIVAVDLEDQPG